MAMLSWFSQFATQSQTFSNYACPSDRYIPYSVHQCCQFSFVVPSKPSSLEISVNSSSVTLQWRPPETCNGIITQYTIKLSGTDINNISGNMLM